MCAVIGEVIITPPPTTRVVQANQTAEGMLLHVLQCFYKAHFREARVHRYVIRVFAWPVCTSKPKPNRNQKLLLLTLRGTYSRLGSDEGGFAKRVTSVPVGRGGCPHGEWGWERGKRSSSFFAVLRCGRTNVPKFSRKIILRKFCALQLRIYAACVLILCEVCPRHGNNVFDHPGKFSQAKPTRTMVSSRGRTFHRKPRSKSITSRNYSKRQSF